MHDTYDILIAGAGPAGCAAAYDLARAGRRVLLLDKRTFPRPKACACGLTRKTLKALRYSVDPVIERVCREIVLQPVLSVITEPDSRRPRRTEVRIKTRNPICAMAVRERFDDFCLNQTLAAARNGGSVELCKIENILALRELPTHIELDVTTSTGIETLRAPALIGADGSNGQTRRLARKSLPPSAQDSAQDGFALEATVPYAGLPTILPSGGSPHDVVFDFSPVRGGYGWLFPKADHINIGVGAFAPTKGPGAPSSPAASSPAKVGSNNASLKQVTRALLLNYAQQKLGVATLAHITGQHLGMGGHAYVPQGRVLLAGDAAGLVDPLTGEGIHSAIISGQAAAAAILEVLAGPTNLSSRPKRGAHSGETRSSITDDLAAAYATNLRPLQETLAFSHRAARAFYAEPNRGFKAMRLPILRSLILKTYADGLPHTRLITTLAKLII
jgi:geranylgeranyl reductase family protein